jgi:hypothetical protein
MNPVDLATVQRALLNYRIIETKPSSSRSGAPGEIHAARLLDEASEEDFEFVHDLLSAQGLHLFRYSHMDMLGIRDVAYGVVYIEPEDGVPGLLSTKAFFDKLKKRRAFRDLKTNQAMGSWWMVLWLTAMGRLYQERHWAEVSKFSDAFIDGNTFAEEIDGVMTQAQAQIVESDGSWLCEVLVGADGTARPSKQKIDQRCFDFLQAFCDAGWLEQLGNSSRFKQTLLGAVDVAEKMKRQFAPILPTVDVITDSASVLVKVTDTASETEDGQDVGD